MTCSCSGALYAPASRDHCTCTSAAVACTRPGRARQGRRPLRGYCSVVEGRQPRYVQPCAHGSEYTADRHRASEVIHKRGSVRASGRFGLAGCCNIARKSAGDAATSRASRLEMLQHRAQEGLNVCNIMLNRKDVGMPPRQHRPAIALATAGEVADLDGEGQLLAEALRQRGAQATAVPSREPRGGLGGIRPRRGAFDLGLRAASAGIPGVGGEGGHCQRPVEHARCADVEHRQTLSARPRPSRRADRSLAVHRPRRTARARLAARRARRQTIRLSRLQGHVASWPPRRTLDPWPT